MSAPPAFAQGLLGITQPSDVVIENAPLTLEQDDFMTRLREIDIERFMRARGIVTEHGQQGTRYKPIREWTQSDFDNFRRGYNRLVRGGELASSETLDALATGLFWEQGRLDSGGDGDDGGEGDD